MVAAWLRASFQGGRHLRRVRKISRLEKNSSKAEIGVTTMARGPKKTRRFKSRPRRSLPAAGRRGPGGPRHGHLRRHGRPDRKETDPALFALQEDRSWRLLVRPGRREASPYGRILPEASFRRCERISAKGPGQERTAAFARRFHYLRGDLGTTASTRRSDAPGIALPFRESDGCQHHFLYGRSAPARSGHRRGARRGRALPVPAPSQADRRKAVRPGPPFAGARPPDLAAFDEGRSSASITTWARRPFEHPLFRFGNALFETALEHALHRSRPDHGGRISASSTGAPFMSRSASSATSSRTT